MQNSAVWDDFLANASNLLSFPQSHSWGQILASEGKEIEYLTVVEGEDVLAEVMVSYEKLFFGFKYAFSPKGPVISKKLKVESYKVIMNEFIKYLKEKKCIFWRIEPNMDFQLSTFNFQLSTFNFQLIKIKDVNPSSTLVVDLSKTPEEILAGMHPKTRYNIGLSKKKDLRIEEKKDLNIFWDLMNKTGQRDAFRLHPKKHYEKILDSELTSQVIIYFENKPIATGVFVRFGQTFTYLYGASDHEYRALMAPYLVQDFGLNKAKNEGFKYYNFFGIAPIKKDETGEWIYDEKHQYAGVTRFKLGFGGEYVATSGTFEIPLSYKVYKVIKCIKSLRSLLKK